MTPQFKPLILLVTYTCNMNCKFCIVRNKLNISYLSLNDLDNILKQAKLCGYNFIAITGGEPCTHPYFYDVIEMIVKRNFGFGIASNGFYYEKYIPLLKYRDKFKYITFSLESYNAKIHDSLRRQGSFKKIIEAIHFFYKKGIDIKISICLNKKNYRSIMSFMNFIDKLGMVKDIRFLSVIPFSWNKKFVLNEKEKNFCLIRINYFRAKTKINLRIMSSLNVGKGINYCKALNLTGLEINPNLDVSFCADIESSGAVLGNLREEKLKDIIMKGGKIANYLKEKRKAYLESGKKIKGYDTCYFCNKILKNNIF